MKTAKEMREISNGFKDNVQKNIVPSICAEIEKNIEAIAIQGEYKTFANVRILMNKLGILFPLPLTEKARKFIFLAVVAELRKNGYDISYSNTDAQMGTRIDINWEIA